VIADGKRGPDGSGRPALADLLGADAVVPDLHPQELVAATRLTRSRVGRGMRHVRDVAALESRPHG
jgi:hypothetical protein